MFIRLTTNEANTPSMTVTHARETLSRVTRYGITNEITGH